MASALLTQLDAIIERLSEPLSETERRNGWDALGQQAMRSFFEEMRSDVVAGKDVKSLPAYVSLARNLDFLGINGGDLHDAAFAIWALARAYDPRGA